MSILIIEEAQKALYMRKNNTANPRYILFKILSTGIAKFKQYMPTQKTLGKLMKNFGYKKELSERQIRRLCSELEQLNLIVRKKFKYLYSYKLMAAGKVLHQKLFEKKDGEEEGRNPPKKSYKSRMSYGNASIARSDTMSTEKLPVDNFEKQPVDNSKKCPVPTHKNVRLYNEYIYNESLRNGIYKNEKFLLSERKAQKINLPHSVQKYVDKYFKRTKFYSEITLLMKRLTISDGEKLYLLEELAHARDNAQQPIRNLCGLGVHKYKSMFLNRQQSSTL